MVSADSEPHCATQGDTGTQDTSPTQEGKPLVQGGMRKKEEQKGEVHLGVRVRQMQWVYKHTLFSKTKDNPFIRGSHCLLKSAQSNSHCKVVLLPQKTT